MISPLPLKNSPRARRRTLFEGLSFQVTAGQALALEGANGAGKTSLLRLIAGFLTPKAGTLTLKDQARAVTDGEERGLYIGWLGHQDGLKPQLTVIEQLEFFARLYRSDSRARRRAGTGGTGAAGRTALPLSVRRTEAASGAGAAAGQRQAALAAG